MRKTKDGIVYNESEDEWLRFKAQRDAAVYTKSLEQRIEDLNNRLTNVEETLKRDSK